MSKDIKHDKGGPREPLIKVSKAPRMFSFGPGQDNDSQFKALMSEANKINAKRGVKLPGARAPKGQTMFSGPDANVTGHDVTVSATYNGENTTGHGVIHLDGKPHKIQFGSGGRDAWYKINGQDLSWDHPLHQKLSDHFSTHWPDSPSGNFRGVRMQLVDGQHKISKG